MQKPTEKPLKEKKIETCPQQVMQKQLLKGMQQNKTPEKIT